MPVVQLRIGSLDWFMSEVATATVSSFLLFGIMWYPVVAQKSCYVQSAGLSSHHSQSVSLHGSICETYSFHCILRKITCSWHLTVGLCQFLPVSKMCCFVPAPQSIAVEPMLNSAGIPKANDLQVWELLAMLVCWWLKQHQFFLKHSNFEASTRRCNTWHCWHDRREAVKLMQQKLISDSKHVSFLILEPLEPNISCNIWRWSVQITIWELGVAISCHLKHSRLAKLQFVILDSVSGGSNLDSLKLRLRKPSGNLGRVFRKIHVPMKLGLDSFQWNCRGVDVQRVIWPACPKGRSQQRSISLVCRRANECLQDTDNLSDENVLQKRFEVPSDLKFKVL